MTGLYKEFPDIGFSTFLTNKATETIVYAKGPSAYLLNGLHEETYMAHVISYALKMGPFSKSM
ncbi:alkaline phosphatase, tissue-nonspecific isozyme-like [Teleopsis dalmanni]|nr:alkaline phosphatase, tissue-nonspecific isozyme-like [Teleopsis dalmanni]